MGRTVDASTYERMIDQSGHASGAGGTDVVVAQTRRVALARISRT